MLKREKERKRERERCSSRMHLQTNSIGLAWTEWSTLNGKATERVTECTKRLRYMESASTKRSHTRHRFSQLNLDAVNNRTIKMVCCSTPDNKCHLFMLYQSMALSLLDYGLGLTFLSQSNFLKLNRIQKEAMSQECKNWKKKPRVSLWKNKETSFEAMPYSLDLLPVKTSLDRSCVSLFLSLFSPFLQISHFNHFIFCIILAFRLINILNCWMTLPTSTWSSNDRHHIGHTKYQTYHLHLTITVNPFMCSALQNEDFPVLYLTVKSIFQIFRQ